MSASAFRAASGNLKIIKLYLKNKLERRIHSVDDYFKAETFEFVKNVGKKVTSW